MHHVICHMIGYLPPPTDIWWASLETCLLEDLAYHRKLYGWQVSGTHHQDEQLLRPLKRDIFYLKNIIT